MKRRQVAIFIAVLAAGFCSWSAQAQQRSIPIASVGGARHFARIHRARGYPAGGLWPGYYPDYGGSADLEVAPREIVEAAQPATPSPAAPPAEPLVLELQGDHWVRIGHGGETQLAIAGPSTSAAPAASATRLSPSSSPAATLPPALMVFRDGHQEELTRYTIAGATIVTPADYWSTGFWTRKIAIADLNLPETLRVNQLRGAQFKLPSGPNEVIVRP